MVSCIHSAVYESNKKIIKSYVRFNHASICVHLNILTWIIEEFTGSNYNGRSYYCISDKNKVYS